MIRPTLEEAKNFVSGNTIIPISSELFSDIKTPIEVLKFLARLDFALCLLQPITLL